MHIAFVVIPLSGHLNPTLPVVRELVARGHRVSYPTTAARIPAIEESGALSKPYETTLSTHMPERDQWMTHMRTAMVDETEFVLPQLLALFENDVPDLIVHDLAAFSGRMLAAVLNRPTIKSVPGLASNAHWAVTQRFAPVDTTAPAHAAYIARLDALLTKHGVSWDALPTALHEIVFLPKAFQFEAGTFGDEFHFVGPCLRPTTDSWQPPPGKRVLLISMGSLNTAHPGFYRMCMEAFGGTDWHVVMSIGDRVTLPDAPSNFEVMPYVPQLEVLEHAAAFLCHAGMGSTMEALHFGVPLVHVPLTPEQDANAFRTAELNLGVTLTDVQPNALREAVEHVSSDPTIAAQVRWMQAEIRAAGGPAVAATVIESVG